MTVFRDTVRVNLVGSGNDTRFELLASFPGQEYFFDQMPRLIVPPFSTAAYHEMGDAGVTVADGRTGEVAIVDWNGNKRTLLAPHAAPDPVPEGELDAWRNRNDQRAARLPDPASFTASARAGLTVWNERPPRPIFAGIVSDSRLIAVQKYQPTDSDHDAEWVVMDATGLHRGAWHLPLHLRIMGIHGDTVLAISRDSLDVESLLVLVMRDR